MLGSLAEIMRFFGGFSVHFGDVACRRAFGACRRAFWGFGDAFGKAWGPILAGLRV